MDVLSGDQKSVTLIPSTLTMIQTLDMPLYIITEYMLENSTSAKGGIRMTITMKRKILSEMMTTYFPSLLLMMITYATTFFKPFFFEAAHLTIFGALKYGPKHGRIRKLRHVGRN